MRIFTHWIELSRELTIDGVKQLSSVYGGSNISEEEALKDAEKKLTNAQRKINGELSIDDAYEPDILEEVIKKIDDDNIVTRNRYGALVLNSKNIIFIDVDQPRVSTLDKMFRSDLSKKELMLYKIEKTASKRKYAALGFRIYETANGYRVLATNKTLHPRSIESEKMMIAFNSDYLYSQLCRTQNCYRARLTPKPYRVKQKKVKVIFPNRSQEQTNDLLNWIKSYEEKSHAFSTCRLIREIGQVKMNNTIQYHDKMTKVDKPYKLA